jgi:hypothetical protein
MVHRLVLTVGGTGIGGLATRSWPRFPSGELQRVDRIKASHLDAASPAPAQRKNGEREVSGVPRVRRTGGAKWLRRLLRKPGKAPRRHPVAEAEAKQPDGTDLAVIASRLGVAGTPGNRPCHGRVGTQEASPTFAPSAMPGSRPTTTAFPALYQIHRPRRSTPVPLGSTWLVDPGPSTALGPSQGCWWAS